MNLPHLNNEHPNVTVPLPVLLHFMWCDGQKGDSQRDFIPIPAWLGSLLHALDRDSNYVYLEPVNGEEYRAWQPRQWRETYERWKQEKIRSEADRQARFRRDAQIAAVAQSLSNLLGLPLDDDYIIEKSRITVLKQDSNAARNYGVNLEQVEW